LVEKFKTNLEKKDKDIEFLKEKEIILNNKIEIYETDTENYRTLKQEIQNLMQEKTDIARQISAATSISAYVVEIENLLKNKLAPINYSRALLDAKDSPVVINNINEIVSCVKKWCEEMEKYLPFESGYINIESEAIE
jgi:ParB family chromosome partitioning protein